MRVEHAFFLCNFLTLWLLGAITLARFFLSLWFICYCIMDHSNRAKSFIIHQWVDSLSWSAVLITSFGNHLSRKSSPFVSPATEHGVSLTICMRLIGALLEQVAATLRTFSFINYSDFVLEWASQYLMGPYGCTTWIASEIHFIFCFVKAHSL